MKDAIRFSLGAVLLGCANTPPAAKSPEPGFLRATPIVEHGVPSVASARTETSGDAVSTETAEEPRPPMAAASTPVVRSTQERVAKKNSPNNPTAVIADANALASQAPEAEGFLNAVMTYTFVPGGIYKVFLAPESVTDVVLEPGEEITGEPAAGDTLRWRLGVGSSAIAGVPQTHLFIKPTRAGLATNLTINTNRRTYFLRLESLESTYMVAVQWNYPQSEGGPAPASPSARSNDDADTTPADVSTLHFEYTIEVVEGHPSWKPQTVFDDGRKTYLRFGRSVLHSESPALFVIERGEMQLVNYRVKKNLYIVDRLFREAELRLGQQDQEIVRIRKR